MATNYLRTLLICSIMWGGMAAAGGNALAQESGLAALKPVIDGEIKYDSNVYNFSSTQANRLDANSAASQASGRFTDMESADDLIVSPRVRLTTKVPGIAGRDLKLKPSLSYNYYLLNQKKSHAKLGLKAENSLGGGSRLGVEIGYRPKVFKKNYLSGTTVGADKATLPANWIYSTAEYSDVNLDVTYSRPLWKRVKGSRSASGIKKIDGEVLVGFGSRSYDGPFGNRDEDTIRVGLALDFKLRNRVGLTTSYLLEFIDTPGGTEVLLRDEAGFGEDFNGDVDTIDQNVHIVKNVDRSRTEHALAIKATKPLENDWDGYAKYDLRIQDYKSNEKYDITRVDRQDIRHRVRVGVKRAFDKNLTYGFGLSLAREKANRDGAIGKGSAESRSYTRVTLSGNISYRF
ncbi:MAG: hypothetical protein ACE5D4_02445 [Thermodesulfobacteriota bacterium]